MFFSHVWKNDALIPFEWSWWFHDLHSRKLPGKVIFWLLILFINMTYHKSSLQFWLIFSLTVFTSNSTRNNPTQIKTRREKLATEEKSNMKRQEKKTRHTRTTTSFSNFKRRVRRVDKRRVLVDSTPLPPSNPRPTRRVTGKIDPIWMDVGWLSLLYIFNTNVITIIQIYQ